MSDPIHITVPAVPVAQPRVKATSRGKHAGVYTPSTIGKGDDKRPHPIAAFKATVRLAAQEQYHRRPMDGAVRVDVLFVFPRQSARIWKTKPMPRYRHIIKPDRDNLDKAVLDSLSGLIFADDCQACSGTIDKWHASGDEGPHCVITITPLDDETPAASSAAQQPLFTSLTP